GFPPGTVPRLRHPGSRAQSSPLRRGVGRKGCSREREPGRGGAVPSVTRAPAVNSVKKQTGEMAVLFVKRPFVAQSSFAFIQTCERRRESPPTILRDAAAR